MFTDLHFRDFIFFVILQEEEVRCNDFRIKPTRRSLAGFVLSPVPICVAMHSSNGLRSDHT